MLDDWQNTLATEGSITFTVRVRAGSPLTKVREQLEDGTWKIDVAAPPEDGKANAELRRFFGKMFSVPTHCVDLLSGHHSKQKILRVRSAD